MTASVSCATSADVIAAIGRRYDRAFAAAEIFARIVAEDAQAKLQAANKLYMMPAKSGEEPHQLGDGEDQRHTIEHLRTGRSSRGANGLTCQIVRVRATFAGSSTRRSPARCSARDVASHRRQMEKRAESCSNYLPAGNVGLCGRKAAHHAGDAATAPADAGWPYLQFLPDPDGRRSCVSCRWKNSTAACS
jgi:hypothetical protein